MATGVVTHRQVRTANRSHECVECRQPIEPGEKYVVMKCLDTHEPDVDDEGRTVWTELPRSDRRWFTTKWHVNCEPWYG